MKSALFVDFDNVYSALRRLDPAVAERFAFQPIQWMRWLTDSLVAPPHAPDGAKRRLLVRRCYLNPQAYQRFRPAFNRAGFEIIDCPPMTSEGKTSTDIHMVLDVVDLVQHEVHYDEFIVFSADADFTPLLRKLRRSDRRTTVLAVGFPSAAYQASADLLIDQDDFIRFGLGFADPEPAPTPASVGASRSAADITKDVRSLIAQSLPNRFLFLRWPARRSRKWKAWMPQIGRGTAASESWWRHCKCRSSGSTGKPEQCSTPRVTQRVRPCRSRRSRLCRSMLCSLKWLV